MLKLKELEKMAPKMKGIGTPYIIWKEKTCSPSLSTVVSQSVKEVLQSLVDDGLVQGDKIGSSNCKSCIDMFY